MDQDIQIQEIFISFKTFSINLISVSLFVEQTCRICFKYNEIFILKNGLHLCCTNLDDKLYILKPYENISYSTEQFKLAKCKSNKQRKINNDLETYM